MNNSAIITLACPACGRAFLTLADAPRGDEICPHCTRAAPRTAYQKSAVPTSPQMLAAAETRLASVKQTVVAKAAPFTLQPQIPVDSPVDLFLRAQREKVAPSQVIKEEKNVLAPPSFAAAPAAVARPLWPGLGIDEIAPHKKPAPPLAPVAPHFQSLTNVRCGVSVVAVLVTLLVAGSLFWFGWHRFNPINIVQPIEQPSAPDAAIKTAATLPVEMSSTQVEIRKPLSVEETQAPSDVSVR